VKPTDFLADNGGNQKLDGWKAVQKCEPVVISEIRIRCCREPREMHDVQVVGDVCNMRGLRNIRHPRKAEHQDGQRKVMVGREENNGWEDDSAEEQVHVCEMKLRDRVDVRKSGCPCCGRNSHAIVEGSQVVTEKHNAKIRKGKS
jgi:hypothetical protein